MKKTKYFTENWALVEENGKVYMAEVILRNMFGKIQFEFNPISKKYDKIGEFRNGMAIVELDDLYGIINEKGEEMCKPQYGTLIHIFSKYFVANDWCIISAEGKVICEYKYIDTSECCEDDYVDPSYEVAIIKFEYRQWGIINSECREIQRRKYDELSFLSNQLLKAEIGNLLIIINSKGEEVLCLRNGHIFMTIDGYYGVSDGRKYGKLSPKGDLIVPIEYANVSNIKDGIFVATIEAQIGRNLVQKFDKNGRKIGEAMWISN